MHLRNAPTALLKQLGHKAGYRYTHSEPSAYAAGQTHLPEGMPAHQWRRPVERGLGLKLGEKLGQLARWDAGALGGAAGGEMQ
jgi:putative ATPase